jgi:glycosyltransferase involved in cell wall biosynthesis
MSAEIVVAGRGSRPTEARGGSVAAHAVPPRHIVLVGPLPPPAGGMANQTRQLATLLNAEGCRVEVVQSNQALPPLLERIRIARALFRLVPYALRLWRATSHADLAHVMANSGWAWHLFAAPAIWIGALRGVPVVVNYRGGSAEAFLGRQIALVRPTLARAALLIVPSGYLHRIFAAHGISATIVPNVVDLAAFAPGEVVRGHPHLLVTRNLERIYDIETAIRAFARIVMDFPDARLTVAGAGPEREALEHLARELRLDARLRFTGRLDNAELPSLYREATLLLNASRVDNMPNSLLEAMASGVPIVSTNVGGIPYLVEDGRTALLVPPGEPGAMADAVLRLLRDPALAMRLRDESLREVSRYAWASVRPILFGAYMRAAEKESTA